MSSGVESILAQDATLSWAEQEALATELIASLDGPPPSPEEAAEIEAAWVEEVKRRVAAAERGEVELIDAEVVFAELEAKYGVRRDSRRRRR